ncbi:MAG: hypothetical protein AAFZ52_10330, partial [Bacteroidota bacterium]
MSQPPVKFLLQNDPRFVDLPDYAALRQRGLDHIAALSGDLWTDHNRHDPGITLLELLCYALTDLGYRTSLDTSELLAPATAPAEDGNFFTPAEILTNNPVTLLDFRKMLIDVPGVRNAWLEPATEQEVALFYQPPVGKNCPPRQLTTKTDADNTAEVRLQGLYHVLLDLEPPVQLPGQDCQPTNDPSTILAEVQRRLGAHRNLCEDFLDVTVLRDEEIGLCLDLDLTPRADPATVLGEVFTAVEEFLSPRIRFYRLDEMLAAGKPMEEIFRGRPYLPAYNDTYGARAASHGFVDTAELEQLERPTILRASDLYRVIMGVDGVRSIRELKLAGFLDGQPKGPDAEW